MEHERNVSLPEDWCEFAHPHSECDVDHTRVQAELDIEIHPDHPFHGRALTVLAHAKGNDDVLCAHNDEPGRYSFIHLTWSGRPELGNCPTIDFDGDWNGVLGYFGYVDQVLAQIAEDERVGRRQPVTMAGTCSRPVVIRYSERNDID
ncbi:hypothetical protein [Burkholderia ubonensis]|uniref:hypothetical protein n=1 Tax=Burkholderia ubonensis TaxID=101571 RepID=UPI001056BE0D|nr:hypothetical protein [Burkholderia ubonensis]